jgi:hypothetical protein
MVCDPCRPRQPERRATEGGPSVANTGKAGPDERWGSWIGPRGAGRGVGRKRAGAEDGGVLVGEVGSERRLGVGGTRVLRPDGRTRRECPLPQGPRTKVFLGVDADD